MKMSLKIWIRIKNVEKNNQQAQQQNGQNFLPPGLSAIHSLAVNEDDFTYVLTEKVYIFHMITGPRGAPIQDMKKVSFSHSPLCAIYSGLF